MAKPLPTNSEQPPEKLPEQPELPKRRASDLTGVTSGITDGGRRTSDRAYVAPKNTKVTLAIWCSFAFSIGLIAWSFSLPFRSGGRANDIQNLPESERVKLEYEARLTAEEYERHVDKIEQDLMAEYQAKQYRPSRPMQSKKSISENWKDRIEKRKKTLHGMKEELKGEDFLKGTIEWQNQKELEKLVEDAPPGA